MPAQVEGKDIELLIAQLVSNLSVATSVLGIAVHNKRHGLAFACEVPVPHEAGAVGGGK